MIIGREKILELIKNNEIVIEPFEDKNVGAASIDLRLGNVFRTFKKSMKIVEIKEETDYKDFTNLVTLNDGYMLLTPGELVHGITMESVKLPPYISGRIKGRSRFARLGLLVHISSGFVAPGSMAR
jgi:dCTP deaminase